ncbi:MAG: carboxypeptidase regulatory-like domain-containing protein, partial [Bacteroidales bacterium]|nr:carboxypeptidase regulatory-like domain-containing protein [Bacteroidales bacterium]
MQLRKWIATGLLCLCVCGLSAQQTFNVRGTVKDKASSQPLEYVTVRVFDGRQQLVKGGISDEKGFFRITGLPAGSYYALLTYTGYDSLKKSFTVSSTVPEANLQTLNLTPSSKQLNKVDVVTQRSQMTLEVDKKVFNVGQDLTKSGSSASELLETIPSVEVDNEGGISLRGNTNVTIWIDGKPSGLTADNQGQILEQMPA